MKINESDIDWTIKCIHFNEIADLNLHVESKLDPKRVTVDEIILCHLKFGNIFALNLQAKPTQFRAVKYFPLIMHRFDDTTSRNFVIELGRQLLGSGPKFRAYGNSTNLSDQKGTLGIRAFELSELAELCPASQNIEDLERSCRKNSLALRVLNYSLRASLIDYKGLKILGANVAADEYWVMSKVYKPGTKELVAIKNPLYKIPIPVCKKNEFVGRLGVHNGEGFSDTFIDLKANMAPATIGHDGMNWVQKKHPLSVPNSKHFVTYGSAICGFIKIQDFCASNTRFSIQMCFEKVYIRRRSRNKNITGAKLDDRFKQKYLKSMTVDIQKDADDDFTSEFRKQREKEMSGSKMNPW